MEVLYRLMVRGEAGFGIRNSDFCKNRQDQPVESWNAYLTIGNKNSIMKNNFLPFLLISMLFLSSCELIGDIFQAGVWSGIIMVVLVVGLIIWLVTRAGRKS